MLTYCSKLGAYLPHIYFAITLSFIAYPSLLSMGGIVGGFLFLFFLKNKLSNFIIGTFTMFFSFWMLFIFISDLYLITEFDRLSLVFLSLGTIFCMLNFIMSILLALPFFLAQMNINEEGLYLPIETKNLSKR